MALLVKSQRLPFNESMHFCFCVKCSYAKIHCIHRSYVCSFSIKYFLPPEDHSYDYCDLSIHYLRSTSDIPLCVTQSRANNTQKR